ncbi:hypothetical protein ILUMI_08632 [Ignelater luminosus]|uniref:Uncharacterized protein n=1 Tax=Ignelater luminosus TaxID=2038154 RepID=A0A8K0D5W9_IGNLU|nr:hypothetical protein ILUMI_08632 [Ignelater luminosus]
MPNNYYLTSKELEAALEEVVSELEIERKGDELTDEENIDDEEIVPESRLRDPDIAGTFEIHLNNAEISEDEFDSSDKETLASKKQKLNCEVPPKPSSEPKWKKGQISYTHSPVSNECLDKRQLNELRFDNIDHTLVSHELKARRRCKICHNHTVRMC